jgi:hypothetical protein
MCDIHTLSLSSKMAGITIIWNSLNGKKKELADLNLEVKLNTGFNFIYTWSFDVVTQKWNIKSLQTVYMVQKS